MRDLDHVIDAQDSYKSIALESLAENSYRFYPEIKDFDEEPEREPIEDGD